MYLPSDGQAIAAEAHRRWAAACPECARRRVLWPIGQNVTTGYEKHATYVHIDTGKEECSG